MKKVILLLMVLVAVTCSLFIDITGISGVGPVPISQSYTVYLPMVMKNYPPLPTPTPLPTPPPSGWTIIKSEDFEGSFPNSWGVFDDQPGYGEYYWGRRWGLRSWAYRDSYIGWAVGAGADGRLLDWNKNYPNYASSWMIYGPFNLIDATAGDLNFNLWVCTEFDYDYVAAFASIDGTNFYGWGWTGDSGGWIDGVLDLTNVYTLGNLMGQPNVWIAFYFYSDYAVNYGGGGYVDNIVLRKYMVPGMLPSAVGVELVLPEGVEMVETSATFVLSP